MIQNLYYDRYDVSDVYIIGDVNLTDSLQEYYSFECTYDTPVYMIHERGDTSQFILNSYYIHWTLFKEYMEHGNLSYVIFSTSSPFFIHSPCQSLDQLKFTNLQNDFDHRMKNYIIPSFSQSIVAFPFFFRPRLFIPNEYTPYQASFHLNALHPETFKDKILPTFSNISQHVYSFVTTDSLPLLKIIQLHFDNVTSYNFNRRRWMSRTYSTTRHMDYSLDVESLGHSRLLVGKCNSAFFNIAYLYQADFSLPIHKNVLCIDGCNEDVFLWLNKNRC